MSAPDRRPAKRAVIASGAGRYSDPWHPFERTTPRLAELVRSLGFDVAVDTDVDHAMRHLEAVDLVVVNAGDPWRGEGSSETTSPASIAGFGQAIRAGIGVLAMHCAVASMRDYPGWANAVGRIWIPSESFHPDAGQTHISVDNLPGDTELSGFAVFDERYCRLQETAASQVVATHDGVNGPEPTAWIQEVGRSRVAVDVLGHDERSYDSPGHRLLIGQLALWAADSRR